MRVNFFRNKRFPIVAFLAFLTVAPFILRNDFVTHVLVLTFIFAIFSLSYDLIVGYMGQVSLGHQVFFGLGASITAVLGVRLGMPPWLSLPASLIGAAVLGLAIGFISLKTRGAFFAIVTLSIAMVIWLVAKGWRGVTGGEAGLSDIPPLEISIPILPKIEFDSSLSFYYLALILLLVTIYFLRRLLKSRFGRALMALRENEARATSLGINAFRYYLVAFTLGGMLASLAGFAYAEYMTTVNPIVLSMSYMGAGLIMVIVGGTGTLGGPIAGAFIFVFVPEFLRIAETLRLVFFGVALVAFILLMPQGIYPSLVLFWNGYIVERTKNR
jgi:branched-chain amino acid transport system permease protein